MKATTLFCAALAIALSAQLIMASNSKNEPVQVAEKVQVSEPVQANETDPNNGMYFNMKSVCETFWCGTEADKVHYVIYDDVDAEHYYEAIRITEGTFNKIEKAGCDGCKLEGYLYAVHGPEGVEYELRAE